MLSANEEEYDILTNEAHLSYLEEALSNTTSYNSNITVYHNYLTSYYDNLTYNFGMNYKGSCGYVGIGMLLSYYDTFLDDSIIPEQYDIVSNGYDGNMILRRNSPGIFRDAIIDPNTDSGIYGYLLSAADYYSYVNANSSFSLHSKLIMLGAQYGYYNFSNNDSPASTNFYIRLNIINKYFEDVLGFDSDDYSLEYLSYTNSSNQSDDVREFAISKVQNNQPVLLSIGGDNGGHVVVAYDYDEETDKLYCHFGWGANKTHVTIESEGFCLYKSALVINFTRTHTHTNNYGVTKISNNIPTTNYYCFESSNLTIVNHSYIYNYIPYSGLVHRAYCKCGEYKSEMHNMVSGMCLQCHYLNNHTHSYDSWKYYNYAYHIEVCECGEIGEEIGAHVIRSSELIDFKAPCLICGQILDLRSDTVILNNTIIKYTVNGSYVLSNGIIILSDEDLSSFYLGNLIFISNNNNVNK